MFKYDERWFGVLQVILSRYLVNKLKHRMDSRVCCILTIYLLMDDRNTEARRQVLDFVVTNNSTASPVYSLVD
jgi:hypothetical protein